MITGNEIKEKIERNNALIEKLRDPTKFQLQPAVNALIQENRKLQTECPHVFVDGYCEYCTKMAGPNDEVKWRGEEGYIAPPPNDWTVPKVNEGE